MSTPQVFISEISGCVSFPSIASAVWAAGGIGALPIICGWAIVTLG